MTDTSMSSFGSEPSVSDVRVEDIDKSEEAVASAVASMANNEYETQLLGFTSKSMSDGIYNAVHLYSMDSIEALEADLKQAGDLTEHEIQVARAVLIPTIRKAMDKAFDKFENYLNCYVLKLPDNVLLPEDQIHSHHHYTQEDEERVDAEIQQLKDRIKAQNWFNSELRKELAEITSTQAQLDKAMEHITHTDREAQKHGIPDLREALVFMGETSARLSQDLAQFES